MSSRDCGCFSAKNTMVRKLRPRLKFLPQTDRHTYRTKTRCPWIPFQGHKKISQLQNVWVVYKMNFTLCVLLVYDDNGSVQTLNLHNARYVQYKVFAQIHCHYKPTIHKGWNSFYIFTLFSCVWNLFYQSLSWKWLCFSWKSNGMHSKWKSLEKIVLCDSNLVIIDTKKKSIFHRVL